MSGKKDNAELVPAGVGDRAFRTVLEGLPWAAYISDAAGRVKWFNQAAREMWGREPRLGEDLWNTTLKYFRTDGSELPAEQQPMAIALREQRPVEGTDVLIENAEGVRRHLRASPRPLFDESGRLAGAWNVLIDVSHEDAATITQRTLASIVENSEDAIISKDLNGVITSWNRGAEQIFGYTAEEAVGQPITLVIPEDRRDEEPRVLERIRRGEKVEHYDTVRRRKDGSLIDISLSVSPITGAGGRIVGASKIVRDISDRRAAERVLKEQSRKKDEFLATLAHELRNPLAPLVNGVDLLRQAGARGAAAEGVLEAMERQLSHLSRLVDDLMEVSRITRGRITLRKEALRLNDVAQSAVDIAKPLIEARGHRFELSLSPQPLYVEGDATRLAQVVSNLLTNASKFTPRGGLVRLVVDRTNGSGVVRVSDNGVGIQAEHLAGVFNMFTQLPCALEGASGGLGIGLALVRQLVTMHGGTVSARSEGADRGSEFTVRLPLMAAPALVTIAPAQDSTPRPFMPRRVLVVDDNRDAAETLGVLLRTLGHDVHLAHSGPDALEAARMVKPEIVLLDLGMPGMDGYQVAEQLRHEPWGKSMRVVAMTGWGQDTDRARTTAAGFDDHLVKPVAFASLQEVLAQPSAQPTRH